MAIERLVPGTIEWQAYYANHITRYQFALKMLANTNVCTVLDAACGVGYGADFLVRNGIPFVTAIDRSEEALKIANSQFIKSNIRYLEDDCHTLEQASNYAPFDAAVSFETLEHLPKPDEFLISLKNVIKPGGALIISTPNIYVSSPSGEVDWKFHEKEYTPYEFIELLERAGFEDIQLFGQQLSDLGLLRRDLRSEFNRLNSNPFQRFGKWVQKTFKKRTFPAVMPEQDVDFEFFDYSDNIERIKNKGVDGPFVMIAVCHI